MRKTRNSRARTKGVNGTPSHTERYFAQAQAIAHSIDKSLIESLATGLVLSEFGGAEDGSFCLALEEVQPTARTW
jgi:hypothetical protein